VSGNFATFVGWSPTVTKEWGRIHFVFGGNNPGWTSTTYNVGAGMSDDGMMHSDKRPVFTVLNHCVYPEESTIHCNRTQIKLLEQPNEVRVHSTKARS